MATELRRKWKDERSPERTKVWMEPQKQRKVAVVYYLSRNGQLEHPHFVEVPLSSVDGLYLRDVIDRLNSLRGKGMTTLYSWSSKRSYKNGFVWHDLAVNDFIYPAHGQEYILKGSELFDTRDSPFGLKSDDAPSPISKKSSSETPKSVDEFDLSVGRSRRNQSWSSIDLNEYKVYSNEASALKLAAHASTQTYSSRNRHNKLIISEAEEDKQSVSYHDNDLSELSRNAISPPPSDSSTETLESLMKCDGKLILRPETNTDNPTDKNPTDKNKTKTPSVLMQLISCGSGSFRDCGPGKTNPGFSFGLKNKPKMLTRGREGDRTVEGAGEGIGENGVVLQGKVKTRGKSKEKVVMEDKEYFSGSLIETKKDEFAQLKRSNSYNAEG